MNTTRDQSLRPLAGVKVVELGALIAGPYAAAILAQFGAEVIKIEPPGTGDALRTWRKLHAGTSLWWRSQSRNKKSVTLNLKSPRGQDIVRRLVRDADIVIENFRPGALEGWGLGWNDLSKINPALVMVRISGYGQSGPYKDRPGFAAIAESMGGLRYVTGYPDRPPVRAGVSIGDTLAGLYGVIGALLAMHHLKVNGGRGQFIDVALYEAVFGVMESLIPEYAAFGHVRERSGASLPGIAPSSTYPCRDGGYVIVAGNGDSIFKRLMHAIGRADLAEDPRFARNATASPEREHAPGVSFASVALVHRPPRAMPTEHANLLLIDIGNTFLKWGLVRAAALGPARDHRIASGHALLAEIPALRAKLAKLPTPESIVVSNVAGTRARAKAIRMFEVWPAAPAPYWLVPQDAQCGVVNRYRNPAQLGSDRWAALIGARRLLGRRPAMVVVCGTATTIDFLTADGVFKGGVILPGVGLMQRSLNRGTAALPDQDGEFADYPTQTIDAIASGCQHAQAGAIERLFAHERRATPDVVCLLSGGAAPAVAPRLTIPHTGHENIVLEGLYAIGMSLHTTTMRRNAGGSGANRAATLPESRS